jgi:tripartite-type tricarboxylate transporter receptor subunit TctC
MVSNYSTLAALMPSSGARVRPLAVTSKQPHPSFVGLPPLAASVAGYSMDIWIGVFAPAGTPAPLVERLNREINEISASPELAVLLGPDGTLPEAMTPAAFATRVQEDIAKWKQVAAEHKIIAE